jgi:hypothetical protein
LQPVWAYKFKIEARNAFGYSTSFSNEASLFTSPLKVALRIETMLLEAVVNENSIL